MRDFSDKILSWTLAIAQERFWHFVNKQSGVFGANGKYPTECWEWVGCLTAKGYGTVQVDWHQYRTHRIAWVLHYRKRITTRDFVCHKCDNPKCVRHDHLFLGDAKTNAQDRNQKQRHAKGEEQGLARLTEERVQDIRTLYATGRYSHRQLAKRFQCSHANIAYVLAGHTWKHSDTRQSI